jgi:hypothetical protein
LLTKKPSAQGKLKTLQPANSIPAGRLVIYPAYKSRKILGVHFSLDNTIEMGSLTIAAFIHNPKGYTFY